MKKNNFVEFNKICFDAKFTLDSGQAFRWSERPDGGWHGVAYGKAVTVLEKGNKIVLEGADEEDFEKIWRRYFDLDRDYVKICKSFEKRIN